MFAPITELRNSTTNTDEHYLCDDTGGEPNHGISDFLARMIGIGNDQTEISSASASD